MKDLIIPSEPILTVQHSPIDIESQQILAFCCDFMGGFDLISHDFALNTLATLNYPKELYYDWTESKPEHCKTKVNTVWKGKHCKPFYQAERW